VVFRAVRQVDDAGFIRRDVLLRRVWSHSIAGFLHT
jgi:hypothetical protein